MTDTAGTTTPDVGRMSLTDVQTEYNALSAKLSTAFKEAGTEYDASKITAVEGDERSKSIGLAAMVDRLNVLGTRKDALAARQQAVDRVTFDDALVGSAPAPDGAKHAKPAQFKSVEHQAFELLTGPDFQKGREYTLPIPPQELKAWLRGETKTVMSLGAGWAAETIREPGSTLAGREMTLLTDLIPFTATTNSAYIFMQQTTRTNNAAEKLESVDGTLQAAAESAFVYTEVSETLRRISHHLPVTDEQIADVPGLLDELIAEMRAGVLEKLSRQIIVGTGTAPQIEGFLDAGRTAVGSVAKGADDVFTAIHNGITTNRETGFAEPDAIICHPSDWHSIRTTTTGDGVFILGSPADSDVLRLWGLPVLVTTHETENTILLGGFARFARVPVKGGVDIKISSEEASYFLQNVQVIKADIRATLAVLREDAFTKVTGV